MYPIGVGAELVCMWAAKQAITAVEPETQRSLTYLMPNAINIEIRFEWTVWLQYFLYSFGFPSLYMYMIG